VDASHGYELDVSLDKKARLFRLTPLSIRPAGFDLRAASAALCFLCRSIVGISFGDRLRPTNALIYSKTAADSSPSVNSEEFPTTHGMIVECDNRVTIARERAQAYPG
jgi:hypothetical protein